jgi:hypothetical protein
VRCAKPIEENETENQIQKQQKIVKVAMPVWAGTMPLFSGKSASNRDPGTRVV